MMEIFGSVPPPAVEEENSARPEAPRGRTPIAIETVAHRLPQPPLRRVTAWLLHQLHLDGHAGRAA